MPKLSFVLALDKILSNLIKQYREHRDALTKIETVFRSIRRTLIQLPRLPTTASHETRDSPVRTA
jgi:hypothetical protein